MKTPQNRPYILIYTDGSCHGNPGPGGYAATLRRIDAEGNELKCHKVRGFDPAETTNVRMEMTAVAAALEHLKPDEPQPIVIRSDNNMIPDSMTKRLPGWIANGWRKGTGKPVLNRGLWERIIAAAEGKTITWEWVRGHAGDPMNEEVDRLAGQQKEIARQKAAEIISR
ncbi:ribonuclease HI [Rhizobium cremeum]|uniref:ribonuclease H family protein n=1 Tax=Rhizobium cremeum TaxID=2813827 RepID=UPI000DE070F1|nr:ribonuclease H [Rhizobium cremeum]MCJ7995245.1 ribonuclease HI [Rhizobium cremeum]MCJ8000443.1 ribonuclease HI [Rhizobium cremeum]